MIVIQNLIDAISLGSVYALAALGIGLIFSIMRLINFAHGELIMVGGFVIYALAGNPMFVMALSAIIVVTILALGMERLAFRPLRKASPPTLLIASFAVSYFVQHVILMIFGSRPMGVDFLSVLGESFEFGGLRVPRLQCIAIVVTLVLMVGLVVFFRASRIGVQMRAAAAGLRCLELAVDHRCRRGGVSKVSGRLGAGLQAAWKIGTTFLRLATVLRRDATGLSLQPQPKG